MFLNNTTYTLTIFHNGLVIAKFSGQTDDIKVFGFLLSYQGQSTSYALKYGGYKVECKDENTGIVYDYVTGKEITPTTV